METKESYNVQARITREDDPELYEWYKSCGNRSAVVRIALARYLAESANLEKISTQLWRVERLLTELVAERMGG